MSRDQRPDLDAELALLKDFQRRTVDHVYDRLWGEDDPTRKFLVADEVGLGKTLVARGVIARTIDNLWDKVDRVDIVYICSNTQIARQNLPKLRVGTTESLAHADRLTLLAKELGGIGDRKLNFVSFTPGTSFQVGSSGGQARERVLLHQLLRRAWGKKAEGKAWVRFFRGGSGAASFKRQLAQFDPSELSADGLNEQFASSIDNATGPRGQPLTVELRETVKEFEWKRKDWTPPLELSSRRNQLIGSLRHLLAQSAVQALTPDLVILDEFQRFKDLMHGDDEGSELARALFDYKDARLLLLSATPYKMYSLPDEPEGDDHYRDFISTVDFLAGSTRAATVESALSAMRAGLYSGDIAAAQSAKSTVETELRRVMTRTERLATTPDRDGMIVEREFDGVELTANDVRDYRRLARTSTAVSGFDPLEFWRSAPYVLEFMEQYQLKRKLEAHPKTDRELVGAIGDRGNHLTSKEIQTFQQIDPANAKMRGLVRDVLDRGAWKLLWIPPSMPYYTLNGPYADPALAGFTKRLIFSAWTVVPKAISCVVSYEAERRIVANSRTGRARSYKDPSTPLLDFAFSGGRLSGMPVLGMIYPAVTLAELGDPLAVARELRLTLPMDRSTYLTQVSDHVRRALTSLPVGPSTGPVDERWYWAAGLMLDRKRRDINGDGVSRLRFGRYLAKKTRDARFKDHVREAARIDPATLGRRPDDLVDVVTTLAVAGPGVVALRALSRVFDDRSALVDIAAVRDAASSIAWSLRGLFNGREVMAVIRGQGSDDDYWREVLEHSVNGGLQAVIDEYVHLVAGAAGGPHISTDDKLRAIALELDAALSLRTSVNDFSVLGVEGNEVVIRNSDLKLRSHFAARFGRGVTEDKAAQREGQVRTAFNSPFWPFVLASTSVGQEGLDFHQYCHAVVHWNLPRNPVELEQREGRVHRYKGHAVRKNVASAYSSSDGVLKGPDVWDSAFAMAAADRPAGESEIFPYWVFQDGDARIERYVPALPLSSEKHKYRRLLRTVGAYRLVIGQPRQDDLLQYLGEQAGSLQDLKIDLSPPDRPGS